MTKNTKTIIGVGAGILLLLYLRNRNKSTDTLKDVEAGDAGESEKSSGGGGGSLGGSIFGGGGGGIAPSPVVINNPVINTTRPLFTPISSVSRPQVSPRPATSSIDPRPATSPATSPNTTQAVSQAPLRSSFLTFDGSFRSPSSLDFDGAIID
jgi:hypothetical protein